jgi:hypothetical protein
MCKLLRGRLILLLVPGLRILFVLLLLLALLLLLLE